MKFLMMGAAVASTVGAIAPGDAAKLKRVPSTASLAAAVLATDMSTLESGGVDLAIVPSAPPLASTSASIPAQIDPVSMPADKRAFGDGRPESQVTTYGGYYNASGGYADRYLTGAFADWQFGATGLNADLLYVNREQNAAYGALGISQPIAGVGRIKLMAGTSSGHQDILPKLFLSAGFDLTPGNQLIVRPAVAYRRFRDGKSQINPSLQFARYFGGSSAGFFVAQADGSLFINKGGRTGWSLGGGITQVRSSGWRFGMAVHRGYMTYDALTGTNVRSITYGGGPNIGFRFASGKELFFRSDITKTRFYTITGAIVGLKLPL